MDHGPPASANVRQLQAARRTDTPQRRHPRGQQRAPPVGSGSPGSGGDATSGRPCRTRGLVPSRHRLARTSDDRAKAQRARGGDPILSGKAARLPARALPQTGRLHSPRLAPSSGSAVTARGAGHTRVRGCGTRRRGGSASNRRARRGGLRRVTLVPSGRERRGGTD